MKTIVPLTLGAMLFFVIPAASAQSSKSEPAFMDKLFPPDLIMQKQRELKITSQQRADIVAAVKQLQSEVSDLQWTMHDEQQKLEEIVVADHVSEAAALAQAKTLLALETKFKLAHLKLLISLENMLTEEQIVVLNKNRGKR